MQWTNNKDANIYLAAAHQQHIWGPTLYSRRYVEIGTYLPDYSAPRDSCMPYIVIADHLAATLGFSLPYGHLGENSEHYERWLGPVDEAIRFIKESYREVISPLSKVGTLYSLPSSDRFGAARILLPELFRDLKISGDPIATVPRGDSIYVCGSQDTGGLRDMARLTADGLRHKWSITGMAFRLNEDEWKPWLPPEDHPAYPEFHDLYLQSLGQAYRDQQHLLVGRHIRKTAALSPTSFVVARNKITGRQNSYCVWPEAGPTLLPEADAIIFSRPSAPPRERVIGYGDWKTVRTLVGELMEPQGMYPERWLVKEHPNESVMSQLRATLEPLKGCIRQFTDLSPTR